MYELFRTMGSLPCFKVELALLAMQLEYRVEEVNLWKGAQHTAEFKNKNPFSKVPVLKTPQGIFLNESNAILRYLAQKTNRYDLFSYDLELRAKIDGMMDYLSLELNDDLGALIWQRYWMPLLAKNVDEERVKKLDTSVRKVLQQLNDQFLQEHHYLCGGVLTLADICFFSHALFCERARIDLSLFPNLEQWLYRMKSVEVWEKLILEHTASPTKSLAR